MSNLSDEEEFSPLVDDDRTERVKVDDGNDDSTLVSNDSIGAQTQNNGISAKLVIQWIGVLLCAFVAIGFFAVLVEGENNVFDTLSIRRPHNSAEDDNQNDGSNDAFIIEDVSSKTAGYNVQTSLEDVSSNPVKHDDETSDSATNSGVKDVKEKINKKDKQKDLEQPHDSGSSKGFHSMSFGGVNNLAHPGGVREALAGNGIAFQNIVIPKSKVENAIPSLNHINIVNHWGHYVHDEHRSPYASYFYDKPKNILDKEQKTFVKKMEAVRKEWGAWDFKDDKENRPIADFNSVEYKDLANDMIPDGSWQKDEKYVKRLIADARVLVNAMTEGIYAEYGSPLKKANGKSLSEAEKKNRSEKWNVNIGNGHSKRGVANLSKGAFDGLVQKLLHALITNDEFYVVWAGHSAAAGHGNNFLQNQVMTFHKIMEPVFDKLGTRLISRNMGMGGVGTLHFSMAGKDLYGETDIIIWDSAMTEKGKPVDFFNKQVIYSGERVPLLLTAQPFKIMQETDNTAWVGNILVSDKSMLPASKNDVTEIPYAARWVNGKMPDRLKYNSICWEKRKDVTAQVKQVGHPGSQVSWHPGFLDHQFNGRKLALIVLKGLDAALNKWEEGVEKEGSPLAESYWHVGDSYKNIRKHLTTRMNKPGSKSDCKTMIPWAPRICNFAMHGFGMWHPRANIESDFLNIIHPALGGDKPHYKAKNLYSGFDLLPYKQKIPDDAIDVHAIAIATTNPPPDLDHSWNEKDDVTGISSLIAEEINQMRRLREAAMPVLGKERDNILLADDGVDKKRKMQHELRSFSDSNNNVNGTRRTAKKNDEIVPGRGWDVLQKTWDGNTCDGSAQSECHRQGNCLMTGHNDQHEDVSGDSMSGWLVFTVPKVKEGVIMVRMEWWCLKKSQLTKTYQVVDDGKTALPGNNRELTHNINKEVPHDFEMDYAVNGKIKTMNRQEWVKYTREISKNCAVWPIMDDSNFSKNNEKGKDVEVAIRFRSKTGKHEPFCISHVYYA